MSCRAEDCCRAEAEADLSRRAALRLGNGEFVNKFEESLVSPTDRPNILYRLVVPKDFGPRIVP